MRKKIRRIRKWEKIEYPKILHNLGKSALIWMGFTFLEMAADSGSNRPIKVINSPLFKLALEDNPISPRISPEICFLLFFR